MACIRTTICISLSRDACVCMFLCFLVCIVLMVRRYMYGTAASYGREGFNVESFTIVPFTPSLNVQLACKEMKMPALWVFGHYQRAKQ